MTIIPQYRGLGKDSYSITRGTYIQGTYVPRPWMYLAYIQGIYVPRPWMNFDTSISVIVMGP